MSLDQDKIAELLPDNTTEQISPEDLRASFAQVGLAYDNISVSSIRALAIDDAGTGFLPGDVNATDFSGRADPDPAPDTFLHIPDGSLTQIAHKGVVYFWMGPSGVDIGLGGDYTSDVDDFAAAGTSNHPLLEGLDTPNQHPIEAVTGLQTELDLLASDDLGHETVYALTQEKPILYVVNDGGTLYADVEALGGGDINLLLDSVFLTLDCTNGAGVNGRARVELTQGADANNPATNYLYIVDVEGSPVIQTTEGTYPSEPFGWLGKTIVPDAATFDAAGPYALQRYTEAFAHGGRGAQSYAREKLRVLGGVYASGASHSLAITTNGGAPDNVHLEVAAGVVYQLHRQTWPAFSVGPYFYGNGQTPFAQVTDLNEALTDANGSSMSGQYFNLVFWGAVSQNTGDCKLFVNLPTASYGNRSQAQADTAETADYTLPPDMRSIGFLISRAVIRHRTASGGTWSNEGLYSLLGTPAGVRTGGSAAAVSTDFSDLFFRISDDGDETKKIAFEASAITADQTRTISMPDADVDLSEIARLEADKVNVLSFLQFAFIKAMRLLATGNGASNPTIDSQYNVATIARTAAGTYRITLTQNIFWGIALTEDNSMLIPAVKLPSSANAQVQYLYFVSAGVYDLFVYELSPSGPQGSIIPVLYDLEAGDTMEVLGWMDAGDGTLPPTDAP